MKVYFNLGNLLFLILCSIGVNVFFSFGGVPIEIRLLFTFAIFFLSYQLGMPIITMEEDEEN